MVHLLLFLHLVLPLLVCAASGDVPPPRHHHVLRRRNMSLSRRSLLTPREASRMLSGTFGDCAGKCAKNRMKCMPAGCDTFNGERDCVIRFNGKDACNGCTDMGVHASNTGRVLVICQGGNPACNSCGFNARNTATFHLKCKTSSSCNSIIMQPTGVIKLCDSNCNSCAHGKKSVATCLLPDDPWTTSAPTKDPTKEPTKDPTKDPTKEPTKAPTRAPIRNPTKHPTSAPSTTPTAPYSGPTNLLELKVSFDASVAPMAAQEMAEPNSTVVQQLKDTTTWQRDLRQAASQRNATEHLVVYGVEVTIDIDEVSRRASDPNIFGVCLDDTASCRLLRDSSSCGIARGPPLGASGSGSGSATPAAGTSTCRVRYDYTAAESSPQCKSPCARSKEECNSDTCGGVWCGPAPVSVAVRLTIRCSRSSSSTASWDSAQSVSDARTVAGKLVEDAVKAEGSSIYKWLAANLCGGNDGATGVVTQLTGMTFLTTGGFIFPSNNGDVRDPPRGGTAHLAEGIMAGVFALLIVGCVLFVAARRHPGIFSRVKLGPRRGNTTFERAQLSLPGDADAHAHAFVDVAWKETKSVKAAKRTVFDLAPPSLSFLAAPSMILGGSSSSSSSSSSSDALVAQDPSKFSRHAVFSAEYGEHACAVKIFDLRKQNSDKKGAPEEAERESGPEDPVALCRWALADEGGSDRPCAASSGFPAAVQLRHPFLARVYGCNALLDGSIIVVVSAWLPRSLGEALRRQQDGGGHTRRLTPQNSNSTMRATAGNAKGKGHDSRRRRACARTLTAGRQLGAALAHLHARGGVHGHIHGENVRLGVDSCDLDCARLTPGKIAELLHLRLVDCDPIGMCPNATGPRKGKVAKTATADVVALGHVLWQLHHLGLGACPPSTRGGGRRHHKPQRPAPVSGSGSGSAPPPPSSVDSLKSLALSEELEQLFTCAFGLGPTKKTKGPIWTAAELSTHASKALDDLLAACKNKNKKQ